MHAVCKRVVCVRTVRWFGGGWRGCNYFPVYLSSAQHKKRRPPCTPGRDAIISRCTYRRLNIKNDALPAHPVTYRGSNTQANGRGDGGAGDGRYRDRTLSRARIASLTSLSSSERIGSSLFFCWNRGAPGFFWFCLASSTFFLALFTLSHWQRSWPCPPEQLQRVPLLLRHDSFHFITGISHVIDRLSNFSLEHVFGKSDLLSRIQPPSSWF